MRKASVLFFMIAITSAPLVARAQSNGATGSCSGSGLAGTVGLAVPNGQGGYDSVQAASVPSVFGAAECQCATQDLALEIKLTSALPLGTSGTVEVWVGPHCDDVKNRTLGTPLPCEKVPTQLTLGDLTTGPAAGGNIEIPIPSAALFSPNVHDCAQPATSVNGVYVLVLTDPSAPLAMCSLESLVEQRQAPTAATDVEAVGNTASITGGVNVTWVAPPVTAFSPTSYQLLCADAAGKPEELYTMPPQYSLCTPTGIERRAIPTSGTLTGPGGGAKLPKTPSVGTFASFDQRFVCGYAGASTNSTTLLLDPTKAHQIEVLAVDDFGNFTPSPAVTVAAAPAMGNDMGSGPTSPTPSHGCSMGGAATTSPLALGFVLLALAGLIVRGRRRIATGTGR